MPLDDAIREHGFRRWYERQLGESFACLLTGFLSLIMMAIALEMIDFRAGVDGLFLLLAIALAGGGVCVAAWARFNRQLALAEYLAERATCPECRAYARFTVIAARDARGTAAGCAMTVRCRGCGHVWHIG
jgi:hypothetical protein